MRATATAAISPQRSERGWDIKLIDMVRNQGESARNNVETRAVGGSNRSRIRRKKRSTESPAKIGFTSHGTPASTPSARTAGHAGGNGEAQRAGLQSIR